MITPFMQMLKKSISADSEWDGNIAEEVGIHKKMHKNARVVLRRGRFRQQMEGLKIINMTLREITKAESRNDVYAQAGIATGYANAMQNDGLMSEDELKDVVDVIGQEGERALFRIEERILLHKTYGVLFREEESYEHTENRK